MNNKKKTKHTLTGTRSVRIPRTVNPGRPQLGYIVLVLLDLLTTLQGRTLRYQTASTATAAARWRSIRNGSDLRHCLAQRPQGGDSKQFFLLLPTRTGFVRSKANFRRAFGFQNGAFSKIWLQNVSNRIFQSLNHYWLGWHAWINTVYGRWRSITDRRLGTLSLRAGQGERGYPEKRTFWMFHFRHNHHAFRWCRRTVIRTTILTIIRNSHASVRWRSSALRWIWRIRITTAITSTGAGGCIRAGSVFKCHLFKIVLKHKYTNKDVTKIPSTVLVHDTWLWG